MPRYKITKVFFVDATPKEEAVAKITAPPGELLEQVFATEQADPNAGSGWGKSLKKQLIGK